MSSTSSSSSVSPAGPSAAAARTRRAWSRLSLPVRRSAWLREFVNTIVERWSRTRSSTARSTCGQIVPETSSSSTASAGGSIERRSGTGIVTCRSQLLVEGGRTTLISRGRPVPVRKAATSSTGSTVADRPMRCAGSAVSASSRASDSARCTPRFVPATAWTSSRITVSTPRSVSRACEVSIRNSDSGVVMRMSGGWVASRRRSAGGVSPVRTPTLSRRRGRPSRSAVRAVPTSGEVRFRSTSTPSAFSGEMYRTLVAADDGLGEPASRSIALRNAARVLPDPVGATTRVSCPCSIASHAAACAGVGASKDSSNHAVVAGENEEGRRGRGVAIAPLWTAAPTPGPAGRPGDRFPAAPAPAQRLVAGWITRRGPHRLVPRRTDEGMIHMAEYTLPDLDYDYGALDPSISGKIMELHHSKHHATYVKGANTALEKLAAAREAGDFGSINQLSKDLAFNLGGHTNHSIFWKNLSPEGGDKPTGELAQAIDEYFGSFDSFRAHFTAAALGIQGSGWAVLAYEPIGGNLVIEQFYDQQNGVPVATNPLFQLDLWEHAFYLD